MRMSHEHGFIFFSNPKTGSESVRRLLDPHSDVRSVPFWRKTRQNPYYSHIRPLEVREIFADRGLDFDAYFKFTFVRNPWVRLVSLYEMIYGRRREVGVVGRMPRALRSALGLHPSPVGFRRWLRTVRPDGRGGGGPPDQRWRVYGTYSLVAFAGDEDGNLLVDEVLRLEDIGRDLPPLLRKLGLESAASAAIPRVNVRDRPPCTEYFDADSIELIRELYRYEIERFDYRFPAS